MDYRKNNSKIQSLESLRFVMALLVVQGHLQIADWSYKYFYNGQLAVIFFFMISGFGMAYASEIHHERIEPDSKWSFKKEYPYAFHRMKKIYFWYMLFILISLPWQFLDLSAWHNVLYAAAGTLATIILTPTMLQSLFGFYQANHLGLGAYWFVSTLFILRLVYPLLRKLHDKIMKSRGIRYVGTSIGVIFLFASLVWCGLHFISQRTMFNDLDYGSPLNCVFYFVIGILLCDFYMLKKNGHKDLTVYEVMLSLFFVLWCLGRNSFLFVNDILQHFIDVGICMALLGIFAFSSGGVSKRVLQNKLLVKLSGYSMYVYLGHYVLVVFIGGIFGRISRLDEIGTHILEAVLVIGLLPILCYFMRKFDERRSEKRAGRGNL